MSLMIVFSRMMSSRQFVVAISNIVRWATKNDSEADCSGSFSCFSVVNCSNQIGVVLSKDLYVQVQILMSLMGHICLI